jgi:AcrR family transcriptional regulator
MGAIAGREPAGERDAELRDRVCRAALVCLARWGLTKTTLEDVAREAGCGRATIYRAFQGGKAEVMTATLASELDRFRREVGEAIDAADPDALDDVVVAGVVAAARFLRSHDALRYLLLHEPDVVLPWVSFHRIGVLYGIVGEFAAPYLGRFIGDAEEAARAAEWLARVVLSYVVNPADGSDLADPVVARHLLSTYVMPGLARAARPRPTEEQCPAPTPT